MTRPCLGLPKIPPSSLPQASRVALSFFGETFSSFLISSSLSPEVTHYFDVFWELSLKGLKRLSGYSGFLFLASPLESRVIKMSVAWDGLFSPPLFFSRILSFSLPYILHHCVFVFG